MRVLLLTAILAIITGCATNITREQWQKADYGEKQDNSAYQAYIQESIKSSLIDPDSLKMSCADARKGWVKDIGYPLTFGWVVYCQVNAKNRFGGYAGSKPYVYLFKGKTVLIANTFGNAERGLNFQYMP